MNIVHVSMTRLVNESRVFKEMTMASAAPDVTRVIAVGRWDQGIAEQETMGEMCEIHRIRVTARRIPFIKHIEWMFRVLLMIRDLQPAILHCHSIATLPLAAFYKWVFGCRLIYDAHELEPERQGLSGTRKWMVVWVERLLISVPDVILTVSGSIADWYASRYEISRPIVVRNIPIEDSIVSPPKINLYEQFGVPQGNLVFIYQGLFARGRGIERLIRVFARLNTDRHLILMGYGPLEYHVRAASYRIANVHYCPAVAPIDVLGVTRQADVGLCLSDGLSLSYQFALPNKLFEYVKAGLAVCVVNHIEKRNFVHQYHCGWVLSNDESEMESFLQHLDRDNVEECRANAIIAAANLDWRREAEYLRVAYAVT